MAQMGWHDCTEQIRDQVGILVEAFEHILEADLVGVYLHGSLAMGCFNPTRSDIDLLVVVDQELASQTKRDLVDTLLKFSGGGLYRPIEISFVARAGLRPWQHPVPYELHYSEEWRAVFEKALRDDSWRQWKGQQQVDPDLAAHFMVTHQRGIALHGEPIALVIPEVPRADYLDSVLSDVLSDDFGLAGIGHLDAAYVILNACRTLAYLREGNVLSKDEGGVWALQHVPNQYWPIIQTALDEYRLNDLADNVHSAEDLNAFAVYMLHEIKP